MSDFAQKKDKNLGSNNFAHLKILDNLEDNSPLSLETLSRRLVLSMERSKLIRELYEDNHHLKEKSDTLIQELSAEKDINILQSEFVSLVSHEFKTPLSIIKASADIITRLKKDSKDSLIQKQIAKINKAVIRMNKLIESTLSLSKLETGKLEFIPSKFCLEELLLEIIERFKDINNAVNFQIEVTKEQKIFYGDKSLIDQVFTNLISNAIKYSQENPKVIVKCHIVENNKFEIIIEDSGIGIDEKDIPKLFSKFYRAHNALGIAGTGIGLYLVKQFLDLHHGIINVTSNINKGTRFTIYLPITNNI